MKSFYILVTLVVSVVAQAKSAKSRGNSFNPDIGINVLFLNQNSDRNSDEDGIKLQEAELEFSSDVDITLLQRPFSLLLKKVRLMVLSRKKSI